MTDALERAARAIAKVFTRTPLRELRVNDRDRDAARAALLAFLDADEAMVEKVARAVADDNDELGVFDNAGYGVTAAMYCDSARAAIAALREMATQAKG